MVGVGGTLAAKVPPCQEIFLKKSRKMRERLDRLNQRTLFVKTAHHTELFGILETVESTGEIFVGPARLAEKRGFGPMHDHVFHGKKIDEFFESVNRILKKKF